VTPGTAFVLLGFGLGALIVAGGSDPRASRQAMQTRADALRSRVLEAQNSAARASQAARDLAAQWSVAEDAARREGR